MSGPATPDELRGKPCVACGSTRTVRWLYAGQVYCNDGIGCGRRMIAQIEAERADRPPVHPR